MNTINAANDDNLKERFQNALSKKIAVDTQITFDPRNKEHVAVYESILQCFETVCHDLDEKEICELVPSILENLASRLRSKSVYESAETTFKKNSIEPTKAIVDKMSKGDPEVVKDEIASSKEIEAMQKQIASCEKKIEILYQKKRMMEQNPLNDTKEITKEIESLQKEQEVIQNKLNKLNIKNYKKLN